MNYQTIQSLYFLTLALYALTEVTLLILNKRSAKQLKTDLPESLKNLQTDEIRKKTSDYNSEKISLSIVQTLYSVFLLFVFIYFGLFGSFDLYLREYFNSLYIKGCLFILCLSFAFTILSIPLSLYATFVIEEKYGFNKTTIKLWLVDFLKSSLLSILIGVPLIAAALYFIETFQDFWWLYVFILFSGFQIILLLVFPTWIAPLFNKFEPLKDRELLEDINRLSDTLSFERQGIFQIDASKRSAHGNAYFAGFGKMRRIVIFDTLIELLSKSEICAVLAHEIGHAKKKHVLKSVIFSMFFMLCGLYLASLLLNNDNFFRAFGIQDTSSYALLLLVGIAFEPVLFFLTPIMSYFSRKNEYEADRYAIDAMGNADDLENALVKLSSKSLSNLSPHPWYSFFHYSHPVLTERIKAMQKYHSTLSQLPES